MIDNKRRKEAMENFSEYIRDGLIKKQKDDEAKKMYIYNSDMSLKLAEKMLDDPLKPYLWSIVVSYYSMFYIQEQMARTSVKRAAEFILEMKKLLI